jgi:glycerol-3-phosphate acyltransferase PlsY
VLIAFDWRLGLAAVAAWLAVAVVTRYSSLGSIVAAIVAPIAGWWILGPGPMLYAVAAMSLVLIARHHGNIAKLARGEESRIGERKTQSPTAP